MMMKYIRLNTRLLLILALTFWLVACDDDDDDTTNTTTNESAETTTDNSGDTSNDDSAEIAANEIAAVALLESLESGDVSVIEDNISATTYIQHNLSAPDGREGLIGAIQSGTMTGTTVDVKRVFGDDDLVVIHSDYFLFGKPQVGFDVFRFEDSLIVEHWDNLQDKVEPTASGRTMLDGSTTITDLDKTADNKALIEEFITNVLVNGQSDKMADYFDGDNYIQHSPNIADGVSSLRAAMEAMAMQGISMTYQTLHKVVGKGNFVLAMSEGLMNDTTTAFYDLFRIENGKIAEHWDVIQTIPPQEEWANNNGKF